MEATGLGGLMAIEIKGVVAMRLERGWTIEKGLLRWEEVGKCTIVAGSLSALLELQQ